MLPIEILLYIGEQSIESHRALLAIPCYARYYQDKQEKIQGMFTVIRESEYKKEYILNGKIHRLNGPAIISKNGTEEWYINNKRHREGGPAYIVYWNIDGNMVWGSEIWYKNGKKHREDGPAVTNANGVKIWLIEDQRHREGGPAVTYGNGEEEWYIKGKRAIR